jgi:PKD repeat protein
MTATAISAVCEIDNGGRDCALSIVIASGSTCDERHYQAVASPNYVPGSIRWNFDDPASGPNNTAAGALEQSHTYAQPGFYRVAVTADFVNPLTGEVFSCGRYQVDTVFAIAAFQADTACAGNPLAFTDLSTFLPIAPISAWEWDFGDPASGAANTSDAQDPTYAYTNAGVYASQLEIRSSAGCLSRAEQPAVAVAPPAPSFELPDARCADVAAYFEADADPELVAWHWDFGDPASGAANTAAGQDAYHRYEAPGTYTISLRGVSRFGCDQLFTREIIVEDNDLSGDIQASAELACEGEIITLTAPPGGSAWLWEDGSTGSARPVTQTGSYRVTVIDANGCAFRPAPRAVEFLPAPIDEVRAVLYDDFGLPLEYVYGSMEICARTDVFIETLALPGHSYVWLSGQSGSQLEFSEKLNNWLTAGEYEFEVLVTDERGCQATAGPFELTVRPLPSATISHAPLGVVCEGTLATFTVNNPDPGLQYIWNNGFPGTVMQTSLAGEYRVRVINEYGCETLSTPRFIRPGPDVSLVPQRLLCPLPPRHPLPAAHQRREQLPVGLRGAAARRTRRQPAAPDRP